jgi:hypothetical protein
MGEICEKKFIARRCFGHLGGKLGNRLFKRLIELGWFELEGHHSHDLNGIRYPGFCSLFASCSGRL